MPKPAHHPGNSRSRQAITPQNLYRQPARQATPLPSLTQYDLCKIPTNPIQTVRTNEPSRATPPLKHECQRHSHRAERYPLALTTSPKGICPIFLPPSLKEITPRPTHMGKMPNLWFRMGLQGQTQRKSFTLENLSIPLRRKNYYPLQHGTILRPAPHPHHRGHPPRAKRRSGTQHGERTRSTHQTHLANHDGQLRWRSAHGGSGNASGGASALRLCHKRWFLRNAQKGNSYRHERDSDPRHIPRLRIPKGGGFPTATRHKIPHVALRHRRLANRHHALTFAIRTLQHTPLPRIYGKPPHAGRRIHGRRDTHSPGSDRNHGGRRIRLHHGRAAHPIASHTHHLQLLRANGLRAMGHPRRAERRAKSYNPITTNYSLLP